MIISSCWRMWDACRWSPNCFLCLSCFAASLNSWAISSFFQSPSWKVEPGFSIRACKQIELRTDQRQKKKNYLHLTLLTSLGCFPKRLCWRSCLNLAISSACKLDFSSSLLSNLESSASKSRFSTSRSRQFFRSWRRLTYTGIRSKKLIQIECF